MLLEVYNWTHIVRFYLNIHVIKSNTTFFMELFANGKNITIFVPYDFSNLVISVI